MAFYAIDSPMRAFLVSRMFCRTRMKRHAADLPPVMIKSTDS